MKKMIMILLAAVLVFSLAACGQNGTSTVPSQSDRENSSNISTESNHNNENQINTDGQTLITLTIGDTVLEGYLNNSAAAQSLIAQLPLTVTLNDSDNDFCGDHLDLSYSESDVTSGYKNGDLVFWTPASNFVIFVSGEESSANTGNLVPLGHITSPQEMLDALE